MSKIACSLVLLWLAVPAFAAKHPVIGQTFVIAEPDTLTEIAAAASGTDWQRWMRKQPKDYGAFDSVQLPRNRVADRALFDPTYTLPQDLLNERGEVLVPRGTRVNALEKTKLPGRYIVIGPTPEDYRWLDEVARPGSRDKVLIANGNVFTERQATQRVLYALDARFVERFGLTGIPSIVQQEGSNLRVERHVLR